MLNQLERVRVRPTTDRPPPTTTQPRRTHRVSGRWRPYAALAPLMILLAVFLYTPVGAVLGLSFLDWNLVSPSAQFVGGGNYSDFIHDPSTLALLGQSAAYIAAALLGNFLLPVGLAMLTLGLRKKAASTYRTLLFAPAMVSTSIGAVVWQFVYLPGGGPLNAFLGHLGIAPMNWLTDPSLVLPSVAIVAVWNTFGFSYVIALGGLTSIPVEQLEAARVDGAHGWRLAWHIMIPLLMPTLLFLAVTAILQALPHAFVAIVTLTSGGPDGRSSNLLYEIYHQGFEAFAVGRASAASVVLMLLISGLAIWQFRILDRRVEYDR